MMLEDQPERICKHKRAAWRGKRGIPWTHLPVASLSAAVSSGWPRIRSAHPVSSQFLPTHCSVTRTLRIHLCELLVPRSDAFLHKTLLLVFVLELCCQIALNLGQQIGGNYLHTSTNKPINISFPCFGCPRGVPLFEKKIHRSQLDAKSWTEDLSKQKGKFLLFKGFSWLLPVLWKFSLLIVNDGSQHLHALDVQLHLTRVAPLFLLHLERRDSEICTIQKEMFLLYRAMASGKKLHWWRNLKPSQILQKDHCSWPSSCFSWSIQITYSSCWMSLAALSCFWWPCGVMKHFTKSWNSWPMGSISSSRSGSM